MTAPGTNPPAPPPLPPAPASPPAMGFGLSGAPASQPAAPAANGAVPPTDPSAPSPRPRPRPPALAPQQLADRLRVGDRMALGRAVSLVESTLPAHRAAARDLLRTLAATAANGISTTRVGITGVPGAGKSTFIERLGLLLVEQGHRVAVLAVDPSSAVSGGSVMGDRTRMTQLSACPQAFIRPSPTAGHLGGVARTTRETMLLCEAAGFDVILIETVGVGQSETAVADMTDVLLALAVPGGGDELQGIKRGLLELVDVIAVNKADGVLATRAKLAAAEYQSALRMMHAAAGAAENTDTPPPVVLTCSALNGEHIDTVWQAVDARVQTARASGALAERRRRQAVAWLDGLVRQGLHALLSRSDKATQAWDAARLAVAEGRLLPTEGADEVLEALLAAWREASPEHPGK